MVWCRKCQEFKKEKTVTFLDIWEGVQGEDIMKFVCPTCNTEQESRRVGRF